MYAGRKTKAIKKGGLGRWAVRGSTAAQRRATRATGVPEKVTVVLKAEAQQLFDKAAFENVNNCSDGNGCYNQILCRPTAMQLGDAAAWSLPGSLDEWSQLYKRWRVKKYRFHFEYVDLANGSGSGGVNSPMGNLGKIIVQQLTQGTVGSVDPAIPFRWFDELQGLMASGQKFHVREVAPMANGNLSPKRWKSPWFYTSTIWKLRKNDEDETVGFLNKANPAGYTDAIAQQNVSLVMRYPNAQSSVTAGPVYEAGMSNTTQILFKVQVERVVELWDRQDLFE